MEKNVSHAGPSRATTRRRRALRVAATDAPVVVVLDGDSNREHNGAHCDARACLREDEPVIVLDSDDETKMEESHSAEREVVSDVIVINSEDEEEISPNHEEEHTLTVDEEEKRISNVGDDDELAIDLARRSRPHPKVSALLRRHGLHVASRSSSGSPTYLVCKFCLLSWPRRARACTIRKAELFAPPFRNGEVRRHMRRVHREPYEAFVSAGGMAREKFFKGLVIPTEDKLRELVKEKERVKEGEREKEREGRREKEREEERREGTSVWKRKKRAAEWRRTKEERMAMLDDAEREGEQMEVHVVLRKSHMARKFSSKQRKKNWWEYVRRLGL